MKALLTILTAGVFVLYPFAVYFGLQYFSSTNLAVILLLVLSIRFLLIKNTLNKMPWLLPASVFGAFAIIISAFSQSTIGFKIYPLIVNASMLIVFAYSYYKPPTVIETFARIKEPQLDDKGIEYTAKVTLVWCVFFIFNGFISLYTALYASIDVWVTYNGFISYMVMGVIMFVEYMVRLRVKKVSS